MADLLIFSEVRLPDDPGDESRHRGEHQAQRAVGGGVAEHPRGVADHHPPLGGGAPQPQPPKPAPFSTGELDQKEVYPYISEGFGEDFVPENYDMSVIDEFTKVTDKDGAIMARRIAKEEGLFCGYSAGSCLQGVMQLAKGPDGKSQLKKLVLLRPVRKYGFCSLGILEVFIARLLPNSFRRSLFIAYSAVRVKNIFHAIN